jgi:hypothetical protein
MCHTRCPVADTLLSCCFPLLQVQIQCLNSVAPAPLNWKMWCPGTDAKVVGWLDKSGASHRQITLRPQPGMTSTMYQWFITSHVLGLMPPVVEFQGNVSVLLWLTLRTLQSDVICGRNCTPLPASACV